MHMHTHATDTCTPNCCNVHKALYSAFPLVLYHRNVAEGTFTGACEKNQCVLKQLFLCKIH